MVAKASAPNSGRMQDAAEADVEARERQDDEAACRQPMGEALETGETQDLRARKSLIDADSSANHQENHQRGKHPEDGDAADDRQLAALEIAPVAAGRLDQAGGVGVRYGDPAR